jgi:2-methylisocitrate lyase-like PEP mutase family enzyme
MLPFLSRHDGDQELIPGEQPAPSPATRTSGRTLLGEEDPLLLPAAHDALTARLIARAGFRAYQVGGFALAGTRYAYPDIVGLPSWRAIEEKFGAG